MPAPDQEVAPRTDDNHPAFATERLTIDLPTATDLLGETVHGVTATRTDDGVKIRALDGMLLGIVTETDGVATLHYRTAPPSEPATLKAERLRETLREAAD